MNSDFATELVKEHYSKEEVKLEVIEFSRRRWIALAGNRWVRYLSGVPITTDVLSLPDTLISTGTRALYATASLYNELSRKEDVFDETKVKAVTPFLDIDNEPEDWKLTVEAARILVDALDSLGIRRSRYVLWSGRGVHVRVNELSMSEEFRGLDSAWALAELVRLKVEERISDLRIKARSLRVENQLKPRALFTVPLSLHRKLDRVAVCVNPDDLDDFDISWAEPLDFKHWRDWRKYETGESDQAVLEALSRLGGYYRRGRSRKELPVDEMIRRWEHSL
ncbi:MAG: hypothetical protein QXH90_06000 [Candidatus Korarchaeum sp.]